jgi:hypothetical protein
MTDTRTRIQEAITSNVTSTAPTPDPTYLREWEKFKEFVDQERLRGQLPQSSLYLHRDAVDLYFAEVVAHRDRIQPGTARRGAVSRQTKIAILSLLLTRPLLSRTIIFLQMSWMMLSTKKLYMKYFLDVKTGWIWDFRGMHVHQPILGDIHYGTQTSWIYVLTQITSEVAVVITKLFLLFCDEVSRRPKVMQLVS